MPDPSSPVVPSVGAVPVEVPEEVAINELATALMDAWATAEPNHSITKHPVSYVATFVDLARAAYPLIAAWVRAEAVAAVLAEQSKFVETVLHHEGFGQYPVRGLSWSNAQSAARLAAGSAVTVATPEPGVLVEAFQGDDEAGEWLPARWTDDDGGWWLPVDQERSPWRGGDLQWRPVASPTEPATCKHGETGPHRVPTPTGKPPGLYRCRGPLPAEQDGQPVDWCKGTPEQLAEARAEVAATEARHAAEQRDPAWPGFCHHTVEEGCTGHGDF